MAGRWWNREIIRSRRRARASFNGRHHRRRDAALPSTHRSLSRGRQSRRSLPDRLKVGVHSLGYVAATTQEAADDFFPGYARAVTDVGKERGWSPMTRAAFDAQRGPQ